MPEARGARLRAAVAVLASVFVLAVGASVVPGPWTPALRQAPWLATAPACLLVAALLAWGRERLRQEGAHLQAARLALRELQRSHAAVLDGIPHPIAVRDAQARALSCNAAYLKFLALPRDQVLGRSLVESITDGPNAEAARAAHQRYLQLLAHGRAMRHDVDFHAGGQVRRLMHWASPILVREDGLPGGLVCGVIDIDERHRLAQLIESARSKAEALSRAKSGFLADMSHEIRTPMNAVLGMLELLLRQNRLLPADRDSVELALGAARALLRLIDDALDLSKVEAGAMDLVARPTDLGLLVRDAAEVFRGRAMERGLGLRVEVDAALAAWHGVDGQRLRQVIGNLVANAIRFTDSGEVVVRLSTLGAADGVESVLLEVSDTGIGMAPEDVRRLFRPFFQASSAGARTQGGTGLGLAIAEGLCARMGGRIEVGSTPGEGTTIRVRLPFPVVGPPADGVAGPDGAKAVEAPAAAHGHFRVLVADDHPANRMLLQRQLGFLGYAVELAEDGRQALDRWLAGGIDAVIADCSMPRMDGYALAAAIRDIERGRGGGARCPILGCTGHVRDQDRHRALDAGMDECLSKPLGLDGLRQALLRHLKEPGAQAALAPPFDTGTLGAISGGDPKVEAQFLSALLDANLADLEVLAGLVEAGGRGAEIASLAHRIKGAARVVAASRVVQDCEALEAAGAAGQPVRLAEACAALERSMAAFNAAISKRLQAGGSLAH